MQTSNIPFNDSIDKILSFPNPFEPLEEFKGYLLNTDGTMTLPRHTPTIEQGRMSLVDSPISIKVSSTFSLRDYQVEPVGGMIKTLSGDRGECLLTAKTGSGKSFSLGYVIQGVGQRTLVLAHLGMLVDQMHGELSDNLAGSVVILSGKEPELGDVNICTFQYLMANPQLVDRLKEEIGFVVVDECENLLTKSRLNIYLKLNPKYQLLMSATPSKELTGRTPMIGFLVGDNKVEMIPDTEIEPKYVMLDYRHLRFMSPQSKMMYKPALTKFFMRSSIPRDVVSLCVELVKFYGCTWIIIDSLKFQDMMVAMLAEVGLQSEVIRGNTTKKERKRILEAVASGECRFLLGSAPLSAGISIPELGFSFRIMPNSSSQELLEQQEGRLKRPAPFKKTQSVLWFDFAIEGSLAYGGKIRMKRYRKTGRLSFGKTDAIKAQLKELVYDNNSGEKQR